MEGRLIINFSRRNSSMTNALLKPKPPRANVCILHLHKHSASVARDIAEACRGL